MRPTATMSARVDSRHDVEGRSAESLVTRVAAAIARDAGPSVFEHVDTAIDEARIVTLSGRVLEEAMLGELADIVGGIKGVAALHNQISVLPVSTRDQDLRLATARAVYGHPELWRYGVNGGGAVHIVVEQGRVTLAGFVDTEADRVVAQTVAQSVARSVTNGLRTPRQGTSAHHPTT